MAGKKIIPNKPLPKKGMPRFDKRKMPLLDGQKNNVKNPSRNFPVRKPSTKK